MKIVAGTSGTPVEQYDEFYREKVTNKTKVYGYGYMLSSDQKERLATMVIDHYLDYFPRVI